MALAARGPFPHGVVVRPLTSHRDSRGSFTEILRESWGLPAHMAQWNVVASRPGAFRGVHLHPRHDDWLVVVAGEARVVLADLREGSATAGLVTSFPVRGAEPEAVFIPHGVGHAFWFATDAIHVYAVSHEWDESDEVAIWCFDPAFGLAVRSGEILLSAKDEAAPPLLSVLLRLAQTHPGVFLSPGSAAKELDRWR